MSQNGTPVVAIETARKKVVGTIRIDDAAYDVLQLTFGQNQRLSESERTDQCLTTMHAIIGEVIPALPQVTRDNIALTDGQVILLFAAAGVKAVEASFPNAVTPAAPISLG